MQEQIGNHEHRSEPATPMGTDPVCGRKVPVTGPHRYKLNGPAAVFCSTRCRDRFASDPSKYLYAEKYQRSVTRPKTPSAKAPSTRAYTCPMHPEVRANQTGPCPKCGMALELVSPGLPAKAEWVCPMHPEIVRDGPGSCPICGMALEPKAGSVPQGEESHELRDMKRQFWFAEVLNRRQINRERKHEWLERAYGWMAHGLGLDASLADRRRRAGRRGGVGAAPGEEQSLGEAYLALSVAAAPPITLFVDGEVCKFASGTTGDFRLNDDATDGGRHRDATGGVP